MGMPPFTLESFRDFIDYNYAVICRACSKKVIEPDKVKGQKYLSGTCPNCGNESVKQRSKTRFYK